MIAQDRIARNSVGRRPVPRGERIDDGVPSSTRRFAALIADFGTILSATCRFSFVSVA